MENATQALLIAGGILLGILTISLLVFAFSGVSSSMKARQVQSEAQRLNAWNAEWEAYNKQVMYGADLVTLMNKAIQNNTEMQVLGDANNESYINIIIKTKDSFETNVYKVDFVNGGYKQEITLNANIANELGISWPIQIKLDANKTYKLGNWNSADELDLNANIVNLFSDAEISVDFVKSVSEEIQYNVYSALTQFKVSIFRCTNVKYNENGRVMEMSFEQI